MTLTIDSLPVYYEEYGEGIPVLCVHGYWVDHGLMTGCLEPVFEKANGYRRVYLDLPGMGRTRSDKKIKNSDDVIALLKKFISEVIGTENFLLAGESFGGYLSLGLIRELGERIDGLLLICPQVDSWMAVQNTGKIPERQVIVSPDLKDVEEASDDFKGFIELAVNASHKVFEKFKKDIQPGLILSDKEYLTNYFSSDYNPEIEKELRAVKYDKPACILTGRQDNAVGFSLAFEMLERFPRATYAVLDAAGHNLQIDNEPLFEAFILDWLQRVNYKD